MEKEKYRSDGSLQYEGEFLMINTMEWKIFF